MTTTRPTIAAHLTGWILSIRAFVVSGAHIENSPPTNPLPLSLTGWIDGRLAVRKSEDSRDAWPDLMLILNDCLIARRKITQVQCSKGDAGGNDAMPRYMIF
ncbi:hypothetical protein B0H16DRAFT_991805 [Mycena metata]|uniref:Uncharacterized protein n=1 Tax=Mycena metata TaxID=1033252 RepID=A0AAD7IJ96_9AGAR|nr:hypothetical protein B0H16DRAFT_991805 [Mycena metata]